MSDNPYGSPNYAPAHEVVDSEAESIRKAHLKHEASVKSIGTLYMLGAIFMVPISVLMMIGGLVGAVSGGEEAGAGIFMVVLGVVYLGVGLVQGATAIGLRRLRTWARYVAVAFSVFGLIGFPIGTLICAYFLYLLLSQKANVIFSERYQQVILATPHIQYRTSKIVIALVVILFLLLGFGIVAALIGSASR